MSDRNDFLHPDFEPGEFDRVERQLRQALATDARRVQPPERLDAILGAAHDAGPATGGVGHGSRRWLVPVAAAAAVAAVIGGVWAANHTDSDRQVTPPMTNTTTAPVTPTPSPTTSSASSSSTAPTTTGPAPAQTQPATLPVYFVGPIGDSKPTSKLFREFVRSQVPADPTPTQKAKAALVLAIDAQPYSNTEGYLQPWSGQTIGDVQVTPQLITVDLAMAGNPDAAQTEEIRRLAVQELVWTAQAAVQNGNVPVRFTVRGGPAKLFGSIPTDQAFTRPASSESWRDLAPIWVDSPTRDQVLPAGKPVTVTGQATVFEASLAWDLRRGTTTVKEGHTTASIGAPERGQYSMKLGTLSPGTYTIHVWEPSAKDGSVAAERSVTFTVK
jgi:hypothetical protein